MSQLNLKPDTKTNPVPILTQNANPNLNPSPNPDPNLTVNPQPKPNCKLNPNFIILILTLILGPIRHSN